MNRLATLAAFGLLTLPRPALAEPTTDPGADEPPPAPAFRFPALGGPSGLAAGLEGFGGINAGVTRGESRAHAFAGAVFRVRAHYLQAGGLFETSDLDSAGRYRAIGGFIGAWIPYSRWVDVEGSVGLASRGYLNEGPEYGPGGLSVRVPSLVLRAGVSDRTTERIFGARIGAALVCDADLSSRDVAFHKTYVDSQGVTHDTSGITSVGGVTVGVVIALGLEVGGGAKSTL